MRQTLAIPLLWLIPLAMLAAYPLLFAKHNVFPAGPEPSAEALKEVGKFLAVVASSACGLVAGVKLAQFMTRPPGLAREPVRQPAR